METIYWTKFKMVLSENEVYQKTNELEIIKEEKELGFVPDGDGFEIDMNGISYKKYLKSPEEYRIEDATLFKISQQSVPIE